MNRLPYLLRFAALIIILISGCKKQKPIDVDPAFGKYISSFTSGVISAASGIKINLNDDVVLLELDAETEFASLFKISPSIEGEFQWVGPRSLEFIPKADLPRNTVFEAQLDLGEIAQVDAGFEVFKFGFRTMGQNFNVSTADLRYYDNTNLKSLYLNGSLSTWDVADIANTELTVTAEQNGKNLPISWMHDSGRRIHSFIVDSISRSESASSVEIKWNGKALEVKDNDGSVHREIPALGDFKVLEVNAITQPEQFIEVQLSDPLSANQNLNGLVMLDGASNNLRTLIDDNILKIYPINRLTGEHTLVISEGIKNAAGYLLGEQSTHSLLFEDLKPSVRYLHSQGSILPSSGAAILPFEAVNLKAVDVKIIRIYEQNIPQFLQVNQLDGERELRRVGRLIAKKKINLNEDKKMNLSNWNRFDLDLSDMLKSEPGAIYRVEIAFRQEYSNYSCGLAANSSDELSFTEEESDWEFATEEASFWDFYDDYYYDEYYYDDYYYDYDYNERDNPCNKAYYINQRPISTNILSSDLGIIAKYGSDGSMHCTVSNLKSTEPISGAEISILDFQQFELKKGSTNAEGMISFTKLDHEPFMLIAKYQNQKGYLRLDKGSALSLSRFDISGQEVKNGVKGFIYGERGVWRPGDTLFLSFILEDEKRIIPEGHPVLFELRDPRGQVVEKRSARINKSNFYSFICQTSQDAPTGTWHARVRAGGSVFEKYLKVEAIKPNRLKIEINFNKDIISATDESLDGKLKVSWLHGAVARKLRTEIKSTFTPIKTEFNNRKDYQFDDPVRRFYPEEFVIFDDEVNDLGEASIDLNIPENSNAPGMLKAHFNTKAFEAGGEFSVDRFSINYSPFPRYVGIKLPKGDESRGMLLTDKDQEVKIVCVDEKGIAQKNRKLTYYFYKVEWKWWWDQNSDDLSNYTGSNSVSPLSTGVITTNANGESSFKIRVNYPDWGRYLVRVVDEEGGHASGIPVYIDWPGWAGRAQKDNPGGASMLIFSADKPEYQVGESVQVSFPSSGVGRALVSIENGSRVVDAFWVDAEKETTRFSFSVSADMAPNIFVNITLVQPHQQTANDLPIRLYGLIPVKVTDPASHVYPELTMADKLKPEQKFDVKVTEKSGKAMTYTLAIVDEGLLNLTRFETPDPWNYFYAREALGVNTWDMYDDVIGAWASGIHPLLAIGGGDDVDRKGMNKANRFKPVVMYLGPFHLDAGKTKTHSLTMPNYVGSVRAMVIAGNSGAYGNAEKSVPVRQALMVLPTLPRTLTPGSKLKMPVTVFAMEDHVKDVTVEIKLQGVLQADGPTKKTMKFNATGDQVIDFDLIVPDKIGFASAEVIVTSGKEKSSQKIEIDISNPNPMQTDVISVMVDAGKTWEQSFDQLGIEGTNEVIAEFSEIPSVDFGRRIKYLIQYPHGCLEQTTSAAFPQLYLEDISNLTKEEAQRAKDHVRAAVDRITRMQTTGGGMTYWPGQSFPDAWASTYAGHFVLEAERKGFPVSVQFKQQWIQYQQAAARNYRSDEYSGSDLAQAYRLYTLALAGQPELGAMNRLKEKKTLNVTATWRLAAAYALAGQKETAKKLIANLSTEVAEYKELGFNYGSDLRDDAMILETLTILNMRQEASPILLRISKKMGSYNWYSTQSTAYALVAYSRFAGDIKDKTAKGTSTFNGTASNFSSTKVLNSLVLKNVKMKGNSIKIKNDGEGPMFVRLVRSGIPAIGNEKASANEISMTVVYRNLNGAVINPDRIEQGTDFMAEIVVSNQGSQIIQNLALTHVFPPGWEILNSRMDEVASVHQADLPTYLDIRDDRANLYFDLLRGKSKTFRVLLNASYKGKFYLPGVNCEAMYDESIHARNAGKWIEVIDRSGALSQK